MPDGIQITVKGISEVNRDLYSYSQQLGDRATLRALREGAKVAQKQIRAYAPKGSGKAYDSGKRPPPGRLIRNILIRQSKIYSKRSNQNKLGVFIYMRAKGKKTDKRNAFYGQFVNDGFYHKKSGRNIPGVKFMERGFETKKTQMVTVFRKTLEVAAEIIKAKTRNLR